MTIQTIPGGLMLPPPFLTGVTGVPAFGNMTALSAANSRGAFVFRVPKTGTLDWFEWRCSANTNNPDNGLRFSFQDVDSNGNPDNTEDQYRVVTSGFGLGTWVVPPGVMTDDGTDGGNKRSVTAGDWLAIVMRFENFVASDNITFSTLTLGSSEAANIDFGFRYIDQSSDGGSSWTKGSLGNFVPFALKYSDGTYGEIPWPVIPAMTMNSRTFNTGSTPDERGLLFQVPFSARMKGFWLRIDLDNAIDVVLYDSGGNVVTSASFDSGHRASANGSNLRFEWPSPPTLTANSNYRLIVKPTTGSNVVMYDFDISATALLAAIDGGTTWMSTNRTDAGAFTDVNTNRPFMGIILDGFDDAAGGGSAVGRTGSIPFAGGQRRIA